MINDKMGTKKLQRGRLQLIIPMTPMAAEIVYASPSLPTLTRLADGFGSEKTDPTGLNHLWIIYLRRIIPDSPLLIGSPVLSIQRVT